MLTEEEREALADRLFAAERDRSPVDALTATHPAIDVEDAYRIQLRNVERRVAAGATIRGHKVGLSAKAMQQMLGVDEPDYGHLLDDMFVFEGFEVPAGRYCFPRVEVEVGFVLGAPLRGPGCGVADVLRATEYLVPAIEIIDSRIRDWKIRLCDTIADNASAAGAVLGNPATAVAWLANKVHRFGVTLEAGHVILPGACMRAYDVGPGSVIRADFDVLGHVGVVFT